MSKIETVTQTGATWGLDRIDQRALPMDSLYSYDFTGAGVTTYIIDTGIRYSHSEFEGRAVKGFDAFAADPTDPLLAMTAPETVTGTVPTFPAQSEGKRGVSQRKSRWWECAY